jgi:hypothetical protein
MIELRFCRSLYSGQALDQAIKTFAAHAECTREMTDAAWVVEVTARRPDRERMVAHELANFALGLTIERGGPDA